MTTFVNAVILEDTVLNAGNALLVDGFGDATTCGGMKHNIRYRSLASFSGNTVADEP